jgi:hypothetical protein
MADLIRTGAAWLTDQLKASAGTTITYIRTTGPTGATLTHSLTATVGNSAFEASTQSGVVERWEARDYIVKADDLAFEPLRGDTIREVVDGVTGVYEVATPRGVPTVHPADAFDTARRIHTKRIN